jgi:beta-glucosidase/6-phospho-beta-glucosidase/beta-galactosidase
MPSSQSIFPTFFLSGFECSTFLWRDQGRRDLRAEIKHLEHVQEDYDLLRELGIGVSREAVPWPLVDRGGSYDFSGLDPYIKAMRIQQVLPVWDLCHYGYPEDLDPFSDAFVERFAAYARAAAEYVIPKLPGPHVFTPINEITFFSLIAGEWGWIAPWGKSRETRMELRRRLCQADIAAVKAIRGVDPEARMLHIDPVVNVVAPRDRPDLAEAAREETYVEPYVASDILCGRRDPQFGGSPEVLDIVGVNAYSFGQKEYRPKGEHAPLPQGDDRIVPLCELLTFAWNRYQRPMMIGETSGLKDGRESWLNDVVQEALAAVYQGIDLHGICLYPAVDMPDWNTGTWVHNGIADVIEDDGDLRRVPNVAYVAALRRWQKRLNRVTHLDDDPLSDPVNLDDIRHAAERLMLQPDANWS